MKKIFQSKLKKIKRKKPRSGWVKACKRMVKNGDDKLLIPDVFEDELLRNGSNTFVLNACCNKYFVPIELKRLIIFYSLKAAR